MPAWHLRDYHDDDLDQAIRIWDQSRQADEDPVFPVSEVMAAARPGPVRRELLTPAEIEFAARTGAQAAFEREVTHHQNY